MGLSVKGIAAVILFVAVSAQTLAIQYGPSGALSGVAIGLVLGGLVAYMVSPHNDWRPRNPLWVIVPLVGGVALTPAVFGAPLPLGVFACIAAWYASPHMWWRPVWRMVAGSWLVLVAGFILVALMVVSGGNY
jgi:hypothetical protein